ncbi:delta-endotoxin CytB [Armillaria borealis]|uniref:Delta-endotoxin CytB n=1 Tax=Armillaria borealis TaxID=47425 RepID=A0AA39JKT6_9AGAR|nr:delta-endotoxin CytB [Armillaria borealis]
MNYYLRFEGSRDSLVDGLKLRLSWSRPRLLSPHLLNLYNHSSCARPKIFLQTRLHINKPYFIMFFNKFSANPGLAFDRFSKLHESLVPASVNFMKFPGRYVKFDDTTGKKHFDWKDFRAAIDRYPALDLANFLFRSSVISQADVTVSVMSKKIATFLDDALQAGVDLHELETTVEATFTHLNEKKEKGVADFYPSTEEGTRRSSWECRLWFALPNEYLRNYFCCMVTTIKLEANIEDEESWVLQGSTTKNFSATVDSLKVYVSKDFKGLYI